MAVYPVFYSESAYGTGDIKTGSPNISISGGVATLDVAQTGNIGAGCDIEYNSLHAYIAPNRIPFTSGGTTSIKPGDKIQGATSTATGIVRAVAVTTGSWANGDAAGYIYFEQTSGTWNSSEQIDRIRPTSSTNVATTNGTLQGNIGNGNTEFVVLTATGSDAPDQSSTAVTSIHHEYASMSALEAGFTDADHLNNTDLTAISVVMYACAYYDHADYTHETNFAINFGTTSSDYYFVAFAPRGGAESINRQGHQGIRDSNKVWFYATGQYVYTIDISQSYTVIEGFQIQSSTYDSSQYTLHLAAGGTGSDIRNNIMFKDDATTSAKYGIGPTSSFVFPIYVHDNIFYDLTGWIYYTTSSDTSGHACIYNNTIVDCANGIYINSDSQTIAKNNLVFNSGDNFSGTFYTGTTNNAYSEDSDPGSNGLDISSYAGNDIFNDYTNDDFHLKSGSPVIDHGADLSSDSDLPLWRDIDGDDRTGGTWDIGADEYVSGAPAAFKAFWAKNSTVTIGELG